jgi:hypothetical protein
LGDFLVIKEYDLIIEQTFLRFTAVMRQKNILEKCTSFGTALLVYFFNRTFEAGPLLAEITRI